MQRLFFVNAFHCSHSITFKMRACMQRGEPLMMVLRSICFQLSRFRFLTSPKYWFSFSVLQECVSTCECSENGHYRLSLVKQLSLNQLLIFAQKYTRIHSHYVQLQLECKIIREKWKTRLTTQDLTLVWEPFLLEYSALGMTGARKKPKREALRKFRIKI